MDDVIRYQFGFDDLNRTHAVGAHVEATTRRLGVAATPPSRAVARPTVGWAVFQRRGRRWHLVATGRRR